MTRWGLLLALVTAMGCGTPAASEATATDGVPPATAIAREQLFFSGRSDDGPVLVTLVLQREPRPRGAVLEAKGFVVLGGALRVPFYEQTELDAWPGDEVEPALVAWRAARTGDPMRIEWTDEGARLTATVRAAGAALELSFTDLVAAGAGRGPHGPLTWRASRATMTLDGTTMRGVGIVERLRGETANPAFGQFEQWLLAPRAGSLVLGRQRLGEVGAAVRVDTFGRAEPGPFEVQATERRTHEPTGFELPVSWRLPTDGGALVHRNGTGDPAQGVAPGGGPAVYDIALATSADGTSAALVFHLQDIP